MATKEELSEEINEVLEMNVEWDRLLEDDLELFHELVVSGDLMEPMAKQMAKQKGKEKVEEEIDEWHLGKYAGKVL